MRLGARIAVYCLVCAAEAGFLFGLAPWAIYTDGQKRVYALELEMNREQIRHLARMADLRAESAALSAEHRLYRACMNQHPELGPEAVELCSASAKLDVAAARLKARAAN